MLVKDAMSKDIIAVYGKHTVQDAVKLMVEKHIGSVLVADHEKGVGILTETDILKRVIYEGLNPADIKVKKVMSTPLITIEKLSNTQSAIHLMEKHKIKKLGVTHDSALVGIITTSDLIKAQPTLVTELMDTWLKPEWK